jgi:hypothetical protein
MKAISFLFAAGMALVLAFAFSCSNSDENPFAEPRLYCVNSVERTCVPGVFKECPSGAAPKDVCPEGFVEKTSSSSSVRVVSVSSSSRGNSSSSSGVGGQQNLYCVYNLFGETKVCISSTVAECPWFGGGTSKNECPAGYEDVTGTSMYYDPDNIHERCRNGVVEERCGVDGNEVWYNPLMHVCADDRYVSCAHNPNTNTSVCDTTYTYYGELLTYERCGNEIFVPIENERERVRMRCQGEVIVLERKFEDIWYNYETHYVDCDKEDIICSVKAKERCGSKYYIPDTRERCRNGVVETKCGYDENEIWYNYETHYCDYPTVKARELCGSKYIGDYSERCNNGVFEEKCNATWYNPTTQSCNWNTSTVKAKQRCGSW